MGRFERAITIPSTHVRCVSCLLIIFTLAGLLCCGSVRAFTSGRAERSPEQLVSDLIAKLSRSEIDRIEIYYLNWSATYAALSQEDLLRQADYRVTVFRPKWKTEDLVSALKTFRFRRYEGIPRDPGDYRLGCVFYSKGGKEVMHLFFAGSIPLVSIYGIPYETTVELLDAVAHLTPCHAYEEMRRAILSLWVHSHMDSSSSGEPLKAD
jgi:hypothetical protein